MKKGTALNQKQYRILEALAACAKVAAKTREEDLTPEFQADLSGRKNLLALEADRAGIAWGLQNQTYYQAQSHPYEYNRQTIDRALRRFNTL